MNNGIILKYSTGISALLLASVAAYFSITGLSKLFAGTGTAIIIMASVLELSKLVTVSYLYRYWKSTSTLLKFYLTVAVTILMIITSLGIFGFLTAGYQGTKTQFELSNTSTVSSINKKQSIDNKIETIKSSISTNSQRITRLNALRDNAENRINQSFDKNKFSVSNKQSNAASNIDKEIKILNNKIDTLESTINTLQDSSSAIQLLIMQSKLQNESSTELGPLVYVSNITGISLDTITGILILLFIFVFDPLAVVLLIVFNKLSMDSIPVTVLEPHIEPSPAPEYKDIPEQETVAVKPVSDIQEEIIKFKDELEAPVTKKQESPRNNKPKLYGDTR